ncbi:MAG: glucans biosynthesis glucosyltransferase MdoH [Gammaproteobacteria bacterium]
MPDHHSLARRRAVFAALVVSSALALVGLLFHLLRIDGFSVFDGALLLCFAISTPWIIIGFWNSAIGFALVAAGRDWLQRISPLAHEFDGPIRSRTAIVMPVFNEVPSSVFQHLRVVADSLARTGEARHFELHLLSDTNDPELLAAEVAHVDAWNTQGAALALRYRHRADNDGFKAGNLREFVECEGERFDYFIVLDADSLMSGEAMLRLVRAMQAHPEIGIVQTLAVGLPSESPFARIFQFGMRHAMRPYTIGSAWWQGDQGPYWGHNAIVRMRPFIESCELPLLPGRGPLSGPILSHDQVEAVLMRRAGYEVRVLPVEGGSYEKNPPTLNDFIKRDLRWCQGNLQYLWLLGMPGLRALGRVQLGLAIMMYMAAPAWLGFLCIGVTQILLPTLGQSATGRHTASVTLGLALFGILMTMNLAPKLFGAADVLFDAQRRRAWGGGAKVVSQTLGETVMSMLIGPVIAVAQTVFIAGLVVGRRMRWNAQTREGHALSPGEAAGRLWLQTAFGLGALFVLVNVAPIAALWTAPVLAGLTICIPLACLSSLPVLGRAMADYRVFSIPEELEPTPETAMLETRPVPAFAPALNARAVPAEGD